MPQPATKTPAACSACNADMTAAANIGQKGKYAFLRCADCGTVTVDPFPSLDDIHAYYQEYKGTVDYRAKAGKKLNRAAKRIARLKRAVKGNRFLDVGCNYGFTVKAAADQGLQAFGIDIDAVAVEESRKSYGEKLFRAVSVQDYAAEGNKADIIYTSEVIEHVPDPDSFMAAVAAILAPGGILYLTTPDSGHWRVPAEFTQWEQVIPPEHVTYFTKKGLKALAERHGLTGVKFGLCLKPGIRLTARKAV